MLFVNMGMEKRLRPGRTLGRGLFTLIAARLETVFVFFNRIEAVLAKGRIGSEL
jgi:hypothetical protein